MYKIILTTILTIFFLLNCIEEMRAAEPIKECDNSMYNCSFAYSYWRDEYDAYKAMWNKYNAALEAWGAKVNDINQKYAQKYQLVDGVFPSDLIVVCSYETLSSPPFTTDPYLKRRVNAGLVEISAALIRPDCMLRWYSSNSGMKKPFAPQLKYQSKGEYQQEQAFEAKMKAQGKQYVCNEEGCEWQ